MTGMYIRIQDVRKHLELARGKRAEEQTSQINQQLVGMIENVLDYIEFGKGKFA